MFRKEMKKTIYLQSKVVHALNFMVLGICGHEAELLYGVFC